MCSFIELRAISIKGIKFSPKKNEIEYFTNHIHYHFTVTKRAEKTSQALRNNYQADYSTLFNYRDFFE